MGDNLTTDQLTALLASSKPDDRTAIGAAYEDYVGGPAHDFVKNLLAQGMPGHPLNSLIAGAVPETTTGAGMLLGSLVAPELKAGEAAGTIARNAPKFGPAIQRILGPTIGGILGGAAEKGDSKDALVGGVLGGVTGVGSEATSTLSKWFAKSRLAQKFYQEDPQRFGKVVKSLVKEFPDLSTPEDFGQAVWKNVAQDKLSDMYTGELSAVSRAIDRMPKTEPPASTGVAGRQSAALREWQEARSSVPRIKDGQIVSPRIKQLQEQGVIGNKTDFDTLAGSVRDLRLKGRAPDGDPKMTLTAVQARDFASDISDDIAASLKESVSPKAANRYVNMDRRYARGAEMIRYLKQPGVVDENGRLDMKLLQEQFKHERGLGLSRDFTEKEMQELSDALFRGAPATATDIMARKASPHVRVHAGESGLPKASLFANLMDFLRGNDFAGSYKLGLPYVPPKALSIAAQRAGAGALENVDKPISYLSDESSSE